ncbi:MAG: GNAT family N-acetyltransferase [Firmicutes bacterium]|nr:GNAT family N-acetyltransferase [Bacillota bacterium]
MVHIREYKNGDEEGIIPLFNKVFVEKRSKEYWLWQFKGNPLKEPIIIIAEDNSKLVGQATLLPTEVLIKREKVYAGQSLDVMVDTDYRRQGIYEKMAFKSYDIGIERDIKFRYGFPSKSALEGLIKKLGGILTTEIPLYMKIYNLNDILTALIKIEVLAKVFSKPITFLINKIIYKEEGITVKNDYEIKEIFEFNKDFDKLWEKIKADYPIMSERTSKFLNWRIKDHPAKCYKAFAAYSGEQLEGYIVLKIENRTLKGKYKSKSGSIVDIIGTQKDVIKALYLKADNCFRNEKVDLSIIWLTDSMRYKKMFKSFGFFKTKSTIPFVVKDLTKDKELEDFIIKEDNWYLMPIESDFY